MATRVAESVVSATLAVRWGLLPSRVARPVSRTSDVVRNDLLATLAASSAPIVSVIAPGGYGKSTLIAQFADHDPRRSAWLSVEEDADDPVTLARYLVFALGRVTSIGEDLLHELDGLRPRMRIATAGLAAAIAGLDPRVLVVDDVHRLADRRCFTLLRALAREVPSGSEIVFAARSETPLELARVRAAGELLELGIDDLRFGVDDAADLLRAADRKSTRLNSSHRL